LAGRYWLYSLWKGGIFMPDSQSNDADDTSDASIANRADNKLILQGNQPLSPKELHVSERFFVEQARTADLMCGVIIISLIVASVVAFCDTRSLLSFSFLTCIPFFLSIRRRKEEAIFPISTEDLQIRLKELDVEIEKVRKQNAVGILPFFTWLKHIFKK
jgi:hypothetical protein